MPHSLDQNFIQAYSQYRRLLAIDTVLGGTIVAERFVGREAMSEQFHFDVDCLAATVHIDFAALLGETATLRLRLDDGGIRCFHGIASEVRSLDADGGFMRFRLRLRPWTHAMRDRRNCRVFQNMDVMDIVSAVFQDYEHACYRFSVHRTLRKRSFAMQYRESDLAFISRMLADEGLNYHFEHGWYSAQSAVAGKEAGMPLQRCLQDHALAHARAGHRMLIFDDTAALDAGMAIPGFAIQAFSQMRMMQTGAIVCTGWNHQAVDAPGSICAVPRGAPHIPIPMLEAYSGMIAAENLATDGGERLARMRAESIAQASRLDRAASNISTLAPGDKFALHECGLARAAMHAPPSASTAHCVLSIEHAARNNIRAGMRGDEPEGESGTYRNAFTFCAGNLPIRPPNAPPKPTAPGVQVATVVGIHDREIDSLRDHQVRIRFPWQREREPMQSGGSDSGHPAHSHADGPDPAADADAGIWVRVAEVSAGANWGSCFVPRVGQEVLVGFVAGDIDRPVIYGRLYNGAHSPPFQSEPSQAQAFSGYRSKEAGSAGFNQWLNDDTPQRLAQELSTTNMASRLQLGELRDRPAAARHHYRGTGFELATHAWTCLRAGDGMLISTATHGEAASSQLDASHAQKKMMSCADMARTLSDYGLRHGAAPLFIPEALQALRERTSYVSNVQAGQPMTAPVPTFQTPLILLDSLAATSFATAASIIVSAEKHLTASTRSALRFSAGQALTFVTGHAVSLFTAANGAKLMAASGPVSIQAHKGKMDLLGDARVSVTSSNGAILIEAAEEILFAAQDGYIRLAGGDIEIHCPSSVSVAAHVHEMHG